MQKSFNLLKKIREQNKENNEAIRVAQDAVRARRRELEDKAQQGTITVLEQGELDSIIGGARRCVGCIAERPSRITSSRL